MNFSSEVLKSLIKLNNTFIGEAPLDIVNCQWIRYDGGPAELHFEDEPYYAPDYKIYVRNESNQVARDTIFSIYEKLKNYKGYNYVIVADRLPHFVGRDVKNRAIYSVSIQIQLGG